MPFSDHALTAARAAFVAAFAALPVSTAAANIAMGLGLIAWLASGRALEAWRIVRAEPVVLIAAGLFALLCLSALWSPAPAHEQWNAVSKFRKLLLIPIIASVFDDARWRLRVLKAGLVVGVVTLALSYFSVVTDYQFPVARAYPVVIDGPAPFNATVFKQHITQGWLMSLFAFACLCAAMHAVDRRWRWAFAAIGVLAVIDNLGFVQGRTGHFATVVLLLLWSVLALGRRGLFLAASGIAVASVVLASSGAAFFTRITQTMHEVEQVEAGSTKATSVSHRMAFYRNGLTLVRSAPVFGHGLGSMSTVYAPLTIGKQGVEAEGAGNPHNEYLNLAIQAGLAATALFIALLVMLAKRARPAPGLPSWLGQGVVALVAVSSLFNSTIWDFNEGNMFALLAAWIVASARAPRAVAADVPAV